MNGGHQKSFDGPGNHPRFLISYIWLSSSI